MMSRQAQVGASPVKASTFLVQESTSQHELVKRP